MSEQLINWRNYLADSSSIIKEEQYEITDEGTIIRVKVGDHPRYFEEMLFEDYIKEDDTLILESIIEN